MREVSLILHDIRSVHNVGSIFRTADGAGASKIYLSGYTPGPIDRFGRKVSAFSKVSLGAEDSVPWEKRDIQELIQELKQSGVQIIALEQSENSVPLLEFDPPERVALIVGNEVDGVPGEVLALCDAVVEIPMRGEKESLNVSVATGIALYILTK